MLMGCLRLLPRTTNAAWRHLMIYWYKVRIYLAGLLFPTGFIDFIVEPTFTVLTEMIEKIVTPLIEEASRSGLAGLGRSRWHTQDLHTLTHTHTKTSANPHVVMSLMLLDDIDIILKKDKCPLDTSDILIHWCFYDHNDVASSLWHKITDATLHRYIMELYYWSQHIYFTVYTDYNMYIY